MSLIFFLPPFLCLITRMEGEIAAIVNIFKKLNDCEDYGGYLDLACRRYRSAHRGETEKHLLSTN